MLFSKSTSPQGSRSLTCPAHRRILSSRNSARHKAEAQEHRPPPPTKPLPVLGSRARVSHTLPSRSGPQPWRHRDRCSCEHLMPDDPRRSCGGDASAGERRQTQRKLRWLTHGSLLLCGGVGVWGTPAFCDPPTSGEDYRSLVLRIWDPGLHRASTRLGFPKQ